VFRPPRQPHKAKTRRTGEQSAELSPALFRSRVNVSDSRNRQQLRHADDGLGDDEGSIVHRASWLYKLEHLTA
jgi:hypothetical protein